jgi:signal transduction histidine kinase
MKRRSLRLRLLLAAAGAVFIAMLAAWLLMTVLFARHIERRVVDEMTRNAMQLIAHLSTDGSGIPHVEDANVDQRFDTPASGLYWQVSTSKGSARSSSLWDSNLSTDRALNAESETWSTRHANGPFEKRVLMLERTIRPNRSGPKVLLQMAHSEEELVKARSEFGRELALFLAMLWLILLAASWAQVRLGLHPLRRVSEELAALRRNPATRMTAEYPSEIEPLTAAINELAEARERDLLRARRRAADLAHSLKTPIAALTAQSRRARAAGATEAADGLDRTIAAAAAAIEAELARSRAASIRQVSSDAESNPLQLAENVVDVVERTERGALIVFEVNIDENLRIGVASEDLTEILGALIENAARFAHRRVRVSGASDVAGVTLDVEDDGKGLDISAEIALMRGGRLDEAGTAHHGLGLAIVRDLVEATSGEITLERSELGGLQVHMRWPHAPSSPDRSR